MWLSPHNSLSPTLRLLSVWIPDYANRMVHYSRHWFIDPSLGGCLVRRPPLYHVETRATAHCHKNAACCAARGGRRMGAPGREGGPCLARESSSTRDLWRRRVLDRNDSYRISTWIRVGIIYVSHFSIFEMVINFPTNSHVKLYP
jgi:hypothetical protein